MSESEARRLLRRWRNETLDSSWGSPAGLRAETDAFLAATPAPADDDAEQELRNLLAIIHRDGGHHTSEVGLKQSVKDAHQIWSELRLPADDDTAEALIDVIDTFAYEEVRGRGRCCSACGAEILNEEHDPECEVYRALAAYRAAHPKAGTP